MGCFSIPKGVPNHKYTGEFKQLVVETMMTERLSYKETAKRFDIGNQSHVANWERIYLMEGPEGLHIERRGRGSKGRPAKFPKEVEEDLLKEVQRLRAENAYLKNASLGFGRRATQEQKAKVIQELRREHDLTTLLEQAFQQIPDNIGLLLQ